DLIMNGPSNTRITLMNGTSPAGQGFIGNGGGSFPVNVVGDFDGDGNADIAGGGATIRVNLLNGTSSVGNGFLGSGGNTLAAAADTNGDGMDDLLFNGASN